MLFIHHEDYVAAGHGSNSAFSMQQLGLDHTTLQQLGLPEHAINSLYRALQSHASAFQHLVHSEVAQLQQLLSKQGAGKLTATVHMLDGPIIGKGLREDAGSPTHQQDLIKAHFRPAADAVHTGTEQAPEVGFRVQQAAMIDCVGRA